MVSVAERAKALAALKIYVFPVLVTPNPENPYKTNKRPAIPEAHPEGDPLRGNCTGQCGKRGHGFWDATIDPGFVDDLFERYPNAHIGVDMGRSGLVAADFDVHRSPDGEIEVDGFDNFELSWLDLPETFAFDSVSGAGGKQFVYAAPEGVKLGPAGRYRKIQGLDRRGGPSYSVWNADAPTSRDVFTPAPEWLLDPATVRDTEAFDGTVKEWLDSLEPGEPSLIVRAAMDRTRQLFEEQGNDFDHAALVDRQFEAIRLGSEGHPGVPQLLDLIEELFYARTGSHSRGEDQWAWEWSEALSSGIQKHGAAIDLRKNLPAYDLTKIPAGIPDRLLTGAPGNKDTFRELLATAAPLISDDLELTSLLWNSPRTKDIAREWGLLFVHERVRDYRERPEPVRENPSLENKKVEKPKKTKTSGNEFLAPDEEKVVKNTRTFIDAYVEGTGSKGFWNPAYAYPSAWTALSMTFGCVARIPLNGAKGMGVNLWFIPLGLSGTGKTSELHFLKDVLNLALKEEDTYYNLGASSSPQGIHDGLLPRDNKPSMILADEAASFFSEMRENKWSRQLEYDLSNYYMGDVEPSSKVRLKADSGKSAKTSFNMHMTGTPDRVMELVTTEMFETGFIARFNWTWSDPPANDDYRFEFHDAPVDVNGTNPVVCELAVDLVTARMLHEASVMKALPSTKTRVATAFKAMVRKAQAHDRWEVLDPAMTRLGETIWKCAGLTALYDGRTAITERDALVAIYYATEWYYTLIRVVESTSESEFSRDVAEIESYVRAQGGSASEAKINHRFRGLIRTSSKELSDRIDFLRVSGRLIRDTADNRVIYRVNE